MVDEAVVEVGSVAEFDIFHLLKEGQRGGNVVAGFNAPNVVELKDPKPGKTYQIAIFGINGPISVSPINRIFLREAALEIVDR